MHEPIARYAPEYYRNSYTRATLDNARANHRQSLRDGKYTDPQFIASIAYELGMMDAEAWRRDDLTRQGGR